MKLPFRILGALTTLWILYTLYQVSRFGGAVVIDPGTISRIMAVRNEDVITTAIGLTYHGLAGAVLVVTQVLVVSGALVGALLSTGRRRVPAIGVLAAWTGLWLGNALWLRTHGWQHGTSTIGMAVALALALGWLATAIADARASRSAEEHSS